MVNILFLAGGLRASLNAKNFTTALKKLL